MPGQPGKALGMVAEEALDGADRFALVGQRGKLLAFGSVQGFGEIARIECVQQALMDDEVARLVNLVTADVDRRQRRDRQCAGVNDHRGDSRLIGTDGA